MRKVLIRVGIGVALLAVAGGALYAFGGEQTPPAAVRTAYAAEVAAGRQPALPGRFVIPIPGCVCHSGDPVLQMQHSTRRMSECGSCHR
jgi:hypothetical protein